MNNENNKLVVTSTGRVGISFSGLLTIVFIVLKLCGVIGWNWFWVLSPLIFTVGLGLVFLIIGLILLLVVSAMS